MGHQPEEGPPVGFGGGPVAHRFGDTGGVVPHIRRVREAACRGVEQAAGLGHPSGFARLAGGAQPIVGVGAGIGVRADFCRSGRRLGGWQAGAG
jgi:hypothetical protein